MKNSPIHGLWWSSRNEPINQPIFCWIRWPFQEPKLEVPHIMAEKRAIRGYTSKIWSKISKNTSSLGTWNINGHWSTVTSPQVSLCSERKKTWRTVEFPLRRSGPCLGRGHILWSAHATSVKIRLYILLYIILYRYLHIVCIPYSICAIYILHVWKYIVCVSCLLDSLGTTRKIRPFLNPANRI